MPESEENLAEDSGRLIAFALRPATLPAGLPEYQQLLRRFLSDARFQQLTESVLHGLGLRMLGVSEAFGLTLPVPDTGLCWMPSINVTAMKRFPGKSSKLRPREAGSKSSP